LSGCRFCVSWKVSLFFWVFILRDVAILVWFSVLFLGEISTCAVPSWQQYA
jgi:hypothetical protein